MTTGILERLQADVFAILSATPDLRRVNILVEDEGDMESQIVQKLANLIEGSPNRRGLVAVVMLPDISSAEKNLPGPHMNAAIKVQIIEQPIMNRNDGGTRIRSSVAALTVAQALHHQVIGSCIIHARGNNPIEVVDVKKGYLSHMFHAEVYLPGIVGSSKPAAVTSAMDDEGILTLACTTENSQIRYTTNGAYPGERALYYSTPIPGIPAGTTIRAAAYAPGMNPGDVTELLITA
jgi:hypothetical protein